MKPTEQEIRDSLTMHASGKAGHDPSSGSVGGGLDRELYGVIRDWADALTHPAFEALEKEDREPETVYDDALWADLRQSEARDLASIVGYAIDQATTRCEAIIIEELTQAGVAFAEMHPDAPRAQQLREKVAVG